MIKNLIRQIVKVEQVWWFIELTLGTINRVFIRLQNTKDYDAAAGEKHDQFNRKCSDLFSERVVLHGPFKGMRYSSLKSVGSALYPKLLGSYEQEISQAIRYIINQPYTAIVNIGCAEGYYAVGLGMRIRSAKVFAFDTNENALALCHMMGELNGVDLQTGLFCDKERLLELDRGEKALIFCDCEGCEFDLLGCQISESMRNHDFLIETHDFVRINITKRILKEFTQTHDCEVYESIDDILKAYNYVFPELELFDLDERHKVLAEGRPKIMRWIFARARKSGQD